MGISRIVRGVGVRAWGLVAVLAVNAVAGVALWQAYHDIRARAEQRTQAAAQAFAEFTTRSLDTYDQILMDVQALLADGASANTLGGYLRRQRAQHVNLLNLFVFDPQGGIVAGTQDRAADLSDRDYVVVHRDDADVGRFVGQPSVSRLIPGRRFFPMSRRLSTPWGDFAGVVAATIDLKDLSDSFEAAREGGEGTDITISLVHHDGTLYVRSPAANDLIGRRVGLESLGGERARTLFVPSPGTADGHVLTQRQVPHYPLVVVVGIAHQRVLAQWVAVAVPVLAADLAAMVAALLLSAHLVRQTREHDRLRAALSATSDRAEAALTALVQAQAASQRSQKLAVLGGLLADAAGESQSPMATAVAACAQSARDLEALRRLVMTGSQDGGALLAAANAAADGMRQVLVECQRAGDHAAALAQVAADQVTGTRRRFNLGSYVAQVLLLLHPRLADQPHRIDVYIPEDIELESYPGALAQVLIHLVLNSLVHGFDDGRSGVIDVAARLDGERVELVYSDNGKGIPPALHAQVFQPFFTTLADDGRSGLGLAIVQTMVTRVLGGDITLDSQSGRGVHYTIRFSRRAGVDGPTA